jgi:hypothetical protein
VRKTKTDLKSIGRSIIGEINKKRDDYKEKWTIATPRAFLQQVLDRIKHRYKTCHKAAKRKYKNCDLTIDHLMDLWQKQDGKCALTGKKMEHKFNSLFTVSVDRIDSSRGYLQGNVQLLCQAINYAKNCFTNEQFLHFWKSNKEQQSCENESQLSSAKRQ